MRDKNLFNKEEIGSRMKVTEKKGIHYLLQRGTDIKSYFVL